MSPPHLAFPLEVIRKNPLGGDLPSSSTLLDPASSSTLRARLQSPQLVAQVHHSSAATCRPDSEVFQHFRSCFAYAKPSVVQQSVKAKKPSDGDNGTLAQLREAFAEAGLQCYTSVAREIMDSHVDLVSRIDTLARESLALTKRTSLAYANLVPLSATLCCGEDVPSTTLATHLSVVVTAISQAQEQLGDLQAEWTCCLAEEEQTLAGLWDAEDKAEQKQTRGDVEAKAFLETVASRLKLFREGVDGIVHNSQSLLDKIDVGTDTGRDDEHDAKGNEGLGGGSFGSPFSHRVLGMGLTRGSYFNGLPEYHGVCIHWPLSDRMECRIYLLIVAQNSKQHSH